MSTQLESPAPSPVIQSDETPSVEVADFEALQLPPSQHFAERISASVDRASLDALPLRDVSKSWGSEKADVNLDSIPSDPDTIRDIYLQQESKNVAEKQWWAQLDLILKKGGVSEDERSGAQQLIRAHSFDMQVEGSLTDEQVAVYECGTATEEALTAQELDDFKQALTLIDQLSSGALLKSDAARTIVLLEGVPLLNEGKQVAGLATPHATYIDISFIREAKHQFGAEFTPLLGGVLVHEILGHQLERLLTDGKMDYFDQHFDYSDETVLHERFGPIHSEITPKDSTHADSKPVRALGYSNPKEDSATSVEAVGTVLMGWEQEFNKIPTAANTPDQHRADLVVDFLRKAAHWNGKPADQGVATPIVYTENEAGQLEAGPVRVFTHRELDKNDVLTAAESQSVDRLNNELSNKTEITYGLVSSSVW